MRPATAADRDAVLALDGLAAEAGNTFVYDCPEQAAAIRAWLLDQGIGECVVETAELLEVDGAPAGLVAMLTGAELQRRRLLCMMALRRAGASRVPPHVAARLGRSGSTLMRVDAADAYLSRIAVSPTHARPGFGSLMLAHAMERARALGAPRLVLDVADDNIGARAFYARHGFVEIGRAEAHDADGARRIGHVHLARALA